MRTEGVFICSRCSLRRIALISNLVSFVERIRFVEGGKQTLLPFCDYIVECQYEKPKLTV